MQKTLNLSAVADSSNNAKQLKTLKNGWKRKKIVDNGRKRLKKN